MMTGGETKKKMNLIKRRRKEIVIDGTSFREEIANFQFNFFLGCFMLTKLVTVEGFFCFTAISVD